MSTDTSLLELFEAFILQPWLGAAPASVLLQIVALVRLKGILRGLSSILAVITGAVLGLAVEAYFLDPGNLWQLFVTMAAPPMLVLTTGKRLGAGGPTTTTQGGMGLCASGTLAHHFQRLVGPRSLAACGH